MCGRAKFASTTDIITTYNIDRIGSRARRDDYGVLVPGNDVPIVVVDSSGQRVLTAMHWGFGNPYNARVETVATKNFWSDSYANRRCIFPIESFYEGNQWFARDHIVAGAGIWRTASAQLQCSLLTTEANEKVATHHSRMPLILDSQRLDSWLKCEADLAEEYAHAS